MPAAHTVVLNLAPSCIYTEMAVELLYKSLAAGRSRLGKHPEFRQVEFPKLMPRRSRYGDYLDVLQNAVACDVAATAFAVECEFCSQAERFCTQRLTEEALEAGLMVSEDDHVAAKREAYTSWLRVLDRAAYLTSMVTPAKWAGLLKDDHMVSVHEPWLSGTAACQQAYCSKLQ